MDQDDIARSTRPIAAEPGEEPDAFDLARVTEADVAAEISRRMTSWRRARNWPESDEARRLHEASATKVNEPRVNGLRADEPPVNDSSLDDCSGGVAGRSIADRIYSAEFAALLTAEPLAFLQFRRLADGRWDWRMTGRAFVNWAADGAKIGRRSWNRLWRGSAAACMTMFGIAARIWSLARRTLTGVAIIVWRDVSQLPADLRSVAADVRIVAGRATGGLTQAARVALERSMSGGRDIARGVTAAMTTAGNAIAVAGTAIARKVVAGSAGATWQRTAAVAVLALAIAGSALMPFGQTGPVKKPAAAPPQLAGSSMPAPNVATSAPYGVTPDLRRHEIPRISVPTRVAVFAEAASPAATAVSAAKPSAASGKAPPTLIAALKPTTGKVPAKTAVTAPAAATFETPMPPPESAQLIAAPRVDNDAPPPGTGSAGAGNTEGDHGDSWMFDWVYGDGVQQRLPRRLRRAVRHARRRTGTDR